MNRRRFIKNGVLTAGMLGVAPVAGLCQESAKVGVMVNLFKNTGSEPSVLNHLRKYTSYKAAYADLQAGKIDALVSSTHFLLYDQEQFSLFGSFPEHYLQNEDKAAWIKSHYDDVADMHAANGIAAEYVGSLSPLHVRFMRISHDQLSNWKDLGFKVKIGTGGIRTTWFESLGFEPHHGSFKSMTDKQLVNLHSGRLHVTDAFAPALFLNAMHFLKTIENNDKWELKQIVENARSSSGKLTSEEFKSLKEFHIVRDQYSKGSIPLEILCRKDRKPVVSAQLKELRGNLNNFISDDRRFQQEILNIFVDQFKITYHDNLPATLSNELVKCTDAYLDVLSEYSSPLAAKLVNSYRSKVG